MSLKTRVIGYTLIAFVPFALAVLVEGAGYTWLKAHGNDTYRPFLKRGAIQEAEGLLDTRDSFSYLDPHLSHAHNPAAIERQGYATAPGFAVFGAIDAPDALTVVALGGSTTDPLTGTSWPLFLADRLAEAGYTARVLNGGVAGYSSNQELLKLIRDVLPLEPDLVLSLNGVNDLGFMHSTTNHPMVHPYQKRVLAAVSGSAQPASPLLPNAVSAVASLFQDSPEIGLHLGTVVRRADFEQWFSNARAMRAVAAEFEIPYVCFLQPILGAGDYDMAPAEEAMLERTVDQHAHYRDYLGDVQAFYAGARERAAGVPYIVDFTDAFDGHAGMYRDSRHQTEAGSRHLADAVFTHCEAMGLFGRDGGADLSAADAG